MVMIGFRILSVIPTLTAIAVVTQAGAAGLKLPEDCTLRPNDPASCAPLVACLGGTGIYFTGRAIGWNTGTHAWRSSAGFSCYGEWSVTGSLGLGEATIECDNGLTGAAYFFSRDPQTGTGIGLGRLSSGQEFHLWTGHNVKQFLLNQYGDLNPAKLCSGLSKPVS